jgi:hypothetical protein
VLERKAPPTFDVLVELLGRDEVVIYTDVAEAVDALLREETPASERRTRGVDGQVQVEVVRPAPTVQGREVGTQPWDEVGESFWWRNDNQAPAERRGGKSGRGGKGRRGPGRYRRAA